MVIDYLCDYNVFMNLKYLLNGYVCYFRKKCMNFWFICSKLMFYNEIIMNIIVMFLNKW